MQSDGQKSLREYFTSERLSLQSRRSSFSSPSGNKRTLSDDEAEPLSSTPAKKKASDSRHIIIIDSDMEDDEENVFQRPTKFRNSNFSHSPSERTIFRGQSRQSLDSETCKKKTTRSQPGRWSCAACTYSNHPLISYCEMCSTSRDSQHLESAHTQSDLASSSSEVHSVASSSCVEVSELLSCRRNSNSCLSGSSQDNPSCSVESDVGELLAAREVNELSNCMPTNSAICNTSLLKMLNIDGERPTDAISASDSCVDGNLVTDVKAESVSDPCIDFSNTTVHEIFQFCCSRNSSRIYVYDKVLASFKLINITISSVYLITHKAVWYIILVAYMCMSVIQ